METQVSISQQLAQSFWGHVTLLCCRSANKVTFRQRGRSSGSVRGTATFAVTEKLTLQHKNYVYKFRFFLKKLKKTLGYVLESVLCSICKKKRI